MLETLEARLAAQSEALFPDLRPALPTSSRSFPTPRLPSTTKPPASLSRTGAPKPLASKKNPHKKSEDVYVPGRKLPLDKYGNKIPDTDAPHTQLGTRVSKNQSKYSYPQAREFDASGKPVRDIDFTDHRYPHKHPNPHQHVYEENITV